MILLQLTALCIVLIYVLFLTVGQAGAAGFLSKVSIVSMACWITEETCIRFYGFYSYNPSWSLFLGHVPVLIILIWPVLIHSSWDLASQLSSQWPKLIPLAAGALVCSGQRRPMGLERTRNIPCPSHRSSGVGHSCFSLHPVL